jgi:hypothetical protein
MLIVASSVDSDVIPAAEVFLVGKAGMRRLGITNEAGVLLISKNDIRRRGGLAVVVCHGSFHCGALLVDSAEFFDYDERYIQLAPAVVL